MNTSWVVVLRDSPTVTFQVFDDRTAPARKRPRLWFVARVIGGWLLKHITAGLYEKH